MIDDPRRWARDLTMLATVGLRQLREDPALLLVQASRRLPRGLRRRLAPKGTASPSSRNAWRAYLADQPGLARELLRGHEADAGLLAAQLGLTPDARDAENRARVAVARGALREAVELGRGLPIGARAASELRILAPGFRLRARPARAGGNDGRAGSAPRVAMLLTNSLPHTQSGYAQRTHSLLTALRATGVDVEAWTRLGWPATVGRVGTHTTDEIEGVCYHRLRAARLPHRSDERWQKQLDVWLKELADFTPDVIHTTTDFTNGLVAEAAARSLGVPWVYEMRGQLELSWVASRPEQWREQAQHSDRVRLWRVKETEMACRADAVLVLSQVQADELAGRGVRPEKIRVVPNGIDETLLERNTDPADARERLGLPRDGCWVGSVSSLVDYEGLDTLLRAVAIARERGVDVRCAIVGDGVSGPALRALGVQLGLDPGSLVMPGRIPRDGALDWYEALDVFVVSRRDTPVTRIITPLKPLEAMALGRPVVASDLPALREVVGDGGVLVPAGDLNAWADALRALTADVGWQAELGLRARRVASERIWAQDAAACAKMYLDLRGQP